ncbi:MAG: hypothetical protein GY875_06185 [Gammaproteobacteria bacterium]|nr:hypothetical protein [Gammaproteobacteria bacterium]
MLAIISLPLVLTPGGGSAAFLFENLREVERFLFEIGGNPSRFMVVAYIIAVVSVIQLLWTAALLLLARMLRRVVRLVTFPFLREWDGGWAITGTLACASGAILFGIAAWTITAA